MQTIEPVRLDSAQSKPRRVWLYVLGLCVLLIALFIGWLLLERHRGKSALAKYERQLLAQGEKLTFAELMPPIPEGDNNASEFLRVRKSLRDGSTLTLNSPPTMRFVAPGKALVVVREMGWSSGGNKKTFRWKDVEVDLKANAEALVELRQIARSPVLYSSLNYQGVNTRLPHLAYSKAAAQWLSASALYNLHIGDVNAAIHDIEAIVLLSRVSDNPLLLSQLVRIVLVYFAVQDCWPLLQADNISDEQLAHLQRVFTNVDLVSPMVQAVRGERIICRDTIHKLRAAETSFEELGDTLSSISGDDEASSLMDKIPYNEKMRETIRAAIIGPMWRYVWSYEDERCMLEQVQGELTAADQATIQRSVIPLTQMEKRLIRESDYSWRYWATDLFMPALAKGPARAFRYEAHREMTVAAIALKRHHLRHGKYPKSLDELVPEFLREHPVDWMDGQKLRYRQDGDSFVLWSVGDNGKDDRCTPDQTPPYNFWSGPDIVWPQAASAAEVEAYYRQLKSKP